MIIMIIITMFGAKSTVAKTDEWQQKVGSVSPQREAAEEFTRGLTEGVRLTRWDGESTCTAASKREGKEREEEAEVEEE